MQVIKLKSGKKFYVGGDKKDIDLATSQIKNKLINITNLQALADIASIKKLKTKNG